MSNDKNQMIGDETDLTDEEPGADDATETDDTSDSTSDNDSLRDDIISNALSMMEDPRIVAKTSDSDGFRTGWEKLQEIFELAAPSYVATPKWEERVLKASNQVGAKGIPHWCGIFALWAIKKSGVEVGEWKMGSGIASVAGVHQISDKTRIQKGDIGYLDQPFNHHFLIREVHDDGTIDTIDGNSGGNSTIATKDGQPIAKFNAFYTVFED